MSQPYAEITREELFRRGSIKWNGMQTQDGFACDGAWIAEMDFGTAPAVAQRLHQLIDEGVLGYLPGQFITDCRTACARFHVEEFGWDITADQVDLVPDVLTTMRVMIDFFTPTGSAVVVPTPAYMPFLTIPGDHGRECVQVPALYRGDPLRWELDLDGIANACRAGAGLVVLCNPWNPVGRVLTEKELRDFGEMMLEFPDVMVFVDEIHSPLVLPGAKHLPFAALDQRFAARSITATAASKGWNIPGLKCAQAIITDPELKKRWQQVPEYRRRGATTLGVAAATAAFNDGREWLAETLQYIAGNLDLVAEAVARTPGVRWSRPEGTYLTWWDCQEVPGDRLPAERVVNDARVGVNAGITCGRDYERFFRLNAATPRPVLAGILRRTSCALGGK